MKKRGRSQSKNNSLKELLVELSFNEEIEENNLFMEASLGYFFVVLFAVLTKQIDTDFGIILFLIAVMIIWFLRDRRKGIIREYEEEVLDMPSRAR
jgi:hypothetical protein